MNLILKIGILFFVIGKETTNSLRLSKLVVPSLKYRGENVLLECQYELNNKSINNKYNINKGYDERQYRQNNYLYYDNEDEEVLYSVKWYKDGDEFYRFVPRAANSPQNSYSFDGIKVDYKRSNSYKVFLKSITLKTSGLFKCEVSLEGPSFSSVQSESYMQVVYLPSNGPFMQGEEQAYQSGDKLNLNCTSARSFPASKLQFFINDNPITNPKYIISYPDVHHTHGLISTSIGLNMRINSQYFENGVLRIKCVASISPSMWTETVIQQQGLQQSPNIPAPSIDTREALFLVKSSAITIKSMTLLLSANILFLKFPYR